MMSKKELAKVRATVLENRQNFIEDFKSSLKEAQNHKPTVSGKICDMNYSEFSLASVFNQISEQEDNVEQEKEAGGTPYSSLKEEKAVLKLLVAEAKKVFGNNYKVYYERFNGSKK